MASHITTIRYAHPEFKRGELHGSPTALSSSTQSASSAFSRIPCVAVFHCMSSSTRPARKPEAVSLYGQPKWMSERGGTSINSHLLSVPFLSLKYLRPPRDNQISHRTQASRHIFPPTGDTFSTKILSTSLSKSLLSTLYSPRTTIFAHRHNVTEILHCREITLTHPPCLATNPLSAAPHSQRHK